MTDNNVIIAYTRAQAVADGVLVEAGGYPPPPWGGVSVAFTRAAWDDAIVREGREEFHTPEGRVWDVLCFLTGAICTTTPPGAVCVFKASRPSDKTGPGIMMLKAVTHRDEEGRRCLTVMLPYEE